MYVPELIVLKKNEKQGAREKSSRFFLRPRARCFSALLSRVRGGSARGLFARVLWFGVRSQSFVARGFTLLCWTHGRMAPGTRDLFWAHNVLRFHAGGLAACASIYKLSRTPRRRRRFVLIVLHTTIASRQQLVSSKHSTEPDAHDPRMRQILKG